MDEGTWDAEITMYYGPMGEMKPPEKSKGSEVNKMIGPFWVVSNYTGSFGGADFTGQGQFDYDAKQKKYVGSWIDSFSPNPTHMIGPYDAETKTMTFDTTGVGMGGGKAIGKNVVVYEGDNRRTMTMYTKIPDGDTMVKTMEIIYTRAKCDE